MNIGYYSSNKFCWGLSASKKKTSKVWLFIKFLSLLEINELHKQLLTIPVSIISLRLQQKPFQSLESVLVKSTGYICSQSQPISKNPKGDLILHRFRSEPWTSIQASFQQRPPEIPWTKNFFMPQFPTAEGARRTSLPFRSNVKMNALNHNGMT